MPVTTISSREFNQDLARAKRAAESGPVIITDRGRPAYVLMRHDQWQRSAGERQNIRQALDLPGVEDIEFEAPRVGESLIRPADLG